jgi:hypothetical protein
VSNEGSDDAGKETSFVIAVKSCHNDRFDAADAAGRVVHTKFYRALLKQQP